MARPATSRHHGAYATPHPLPPGANRSARYPGARSMANAPRRSRWFSRLFSRAHRPHSSHVPSAQSSGGPHEAHEPAEGG
eukprot:3009159-Prymnesium_polylepis.1